MRALRAAGAALIGLAIVASLVILADHTGTAHAGGSEGVSNSDATPVMQQIWSSASTSALSAAGQSAEGSESSADAWFDESDSSAADATSASPDSASVVATGSAAAATDHSIAPGTPISGASATPTGTPTAAPTVTPTAAPTGTPTATPSIPASGPPAPKPPAPSPPAPSVPVVSAAAGPSSFPDTITPSAAPTAQVTTALNQAVRSAAAQGITEDVVVLDRHTGGTLYFTGADTEVPAMSVAKLLFAVDVLDSAGGADKVAPSTLAELYQMIALSDDSLASDFYNDDGESAIVTRMASRYGLTGTEPAANPEYWGGIEITARDMASFLSQTLADPKTGPFLISAMSDATHTAADGYNQEFGMNAVVGAGSKQGWGCCLGGVVAIHSVGFTADRIVVALSTAPPDASGINVPQVSAFENDPGFVASVKAITAVVHAAVAPA